MDHYQTLGVANTATSDEIKKAYRKLASKHHPDKGGNEQDFKRVQEAYETLSDPQKRAQYDNPNPWGDARGHGFSFEDMFSQGDFGSAFKDIFNRGGHAHNPDGVVDVTITLLQAFQGTDLVIDAGYTRVNLNIPAGTQNGSKFRMMGVGPNRYKDMPPGNLIVRVHIECPPNFGTDGSTIFKRVEISSLDAMTGAEASIKHVNGKTYNLVIPKGIQSGTKLKMKNLGMINQKNGVVGDLVVIVDVYTANITNEEHIKILNSIKPQRREYE